MRRTWPTRPARSTLGVAPGRSAPTARRASCASGTRTPSSASRARRASAGGTLPVRHRRGERGREGAVGRLPPVRAGRVACRAPAHPPGVTIHGQRKSATTGRSDSHSARRFLRACGQAVPMRRGCVVALDEALAGRVGQASGQLPLQRLTERHVVPPSSDCGKPSRTRWRSLCTAGFRAPSGRVLAARSQGEAP